MARAVHPDRPRPRISDAQIWSRDYTRLESVVFATTKIKEILEYHFPFDEGWSGPLLNLLDAIYHLRQWGLEEVAAAGSEIKDYILIGMTPENKRDLSAALLLIDLVEKTPSYRNTLES